MVLLSVTYIACKRSSDAVLPEYYSAPAGFTPTLDIPVNSVNFKSATVTPSTHLGTKVTWTLTYRGLVSGAIKTFSGSSDVIDGSNALWNGSHDGLYFFKPGEKVVASLTFFGSDYVTTDTLLVTTAKDYITGNPNAVAVGVKYSNGQINNGYELVSYFDYPYQLPLGSGAPFCYSPTLPVPNEKRVHGGFIPAVEGNYYFRVKDISHDADGYFVGGLQHRNPGGFFFPTWNDPENIYFNIYIYGYGADSTNFTTINLEFHEADLSNSASKPKNECGVPNADIGATNCALIGKNEHDPCSDDGWVYQVPVTHTGWKLFSVKYSDFTPSTSARNGGSGNKIKEPNRVARIQIGVISSPPKNEVYAIFDYPVITYGAPFDPSK